MTPETARAAKREVDPYRYGWRYVWREGPNGQGDRE